MALPRDKARLMLQGNKEYLDALIAYLGHIEADTIESIKRCDIDKVPRLQGSLILIDQLKELKP